MAINFNNVLTSLKDKEDYIADKITAFAGSMMFVYVHAIWFTFWILANLNVFGPKLVFDTFPFGLLTLVVSLEAIFLSTFVMITQNREAQETKIQNHLNFLIQQQEEKEVQIIMRTLERLAEKQDVDIADLVQELERNQQETLQDAKKLS